MPVTAGRGHRKADSSTNEDANRLGSRGSGRCVSVDPIRDLRRAYHAEQRTRICRNERPQAAPDSQQGRLGQRRKLQERPAARFGSRTKGRPTLSCATWTHRPGELRLARPFYACFGGAPRRALRHALSNNRSLMWRSSGLEASGLSASSPCASPSRRGNCFTRSSKRPPKLPLFTGRRCGMFFVLHTGPSLDSIRSSTESFFIHLALIPLRHVNIRGT